jgi:hypothetical protein
MMLVPQTAAGGVDFIIEAWLLARLRRQIVSAADPILRAS